MKTTRWLAALGIAALSLSTSPAQAAKPVDLDGDGYTSQNDCNDDDATVNPGAPEVCGDGRDNDCSGVADDPEICGDPSAPHAGLTWNGPGTCTACHAQQGAEAHGSLHYQWQGDVPEMVNGTSPQGKVSNSVNSYCINILGNWNGCGACHNGNGEKPVPVANPTADDIAKVDCLTCHQPAYKRVRGTDGLFQPDTANMTITMDEAVQTAGRPTRSACLQCHAKGGGGDNYKRGDMALAHGTTADRSFDVHMATTGADLTCQACHTTQSHRIAGRGSDLRPTDNPTEMGCTDCHVAKADPTTSHSSPELSRHVNRVACQTCHIPTYARNAADTPATEATEVHRTWLGNHVTPSGAIHPEFTFANDLTPRYRFWNHASDNYLLGDVARIDPETGAYPTSRPVGAVDDLYSKLYPFKYKTAEQPLAQVDQVLIALDTGVFFPTGDADAATQAGLANMGLAPQPYTFVNTDTFQLLTHEVAPATEALACSDCHGSTQRMDLKALGYGLKAPTAQTCSQCHQEKRVPGFDRMHDRHVNSRGFDCSWCHGFSRPERGLTLPQ